MENRTERKTDIATGPLFVDEALIGELIDWAGAVEVIRRGHGGGRPELQDLTLGAPDGLLLTRAARVDGAGFAVKAEAIFPGNAAAGRPTLDGAVLLFDGSSGKLCAVVDSRLVTHLKTVADSLLGARLLARADSEHLLVMGGGGIAQGLVQGYLACFPGLKRISLWTRRQEQAQALKARLAPDPRISVVTNLAEVVRTADIIASATSARQPILLGDWVRPGTHVDLIGAFTPEMREADDALMAAARIFVDCRDTTVDRIGELLRPIASAAITPSDILGDLFDLVGSGIPGRLARSDVTVFKNGGGAHLDLMIAHYIVDMVTSTS